MTTLDVRCDFAYPDGFRLEADFSAGPGVTAVTGPSGGGKSTLFALIAGLLSPQRGSIRFGGRAFVDVAVGVRLPAHRRRVGLAFQDDRLFPHLTVRRNLLYGRRRFGTAAAPSLSDVVEPLELGGLLDRRPEALSGGQKQRVALGRALLTGAPLLLLDEPASALDFPLRERVLAFVRETVARAEATCLVVTHDAATAARLAPVAFLPVAAGVATPPRPPETPPRQQPPP